MIFKNAIISELEMTTSRNDKASSDRKRLAILATENGHQMVIYERELRVYAKTNSIVKVFAVMTDTKEKPKWELEFQLKGEEERALLVTSLNKPRQFPQVNYMVELLQDWCPGLEDISLGIRPQR